MTVRRESDKRDEGWMILCSLVANHRRFKNQKLVLNNLLKVEEQRGTIFANYISFLSHDRLTRFSSTRTISGYKQSIT